VYRFLPSLQAGIEVNPLSSDVSPLVNWRALEETEHRPALILGTSSDRIGTPSGQAFYATLSKDLEGWLDLPLAPYAGVSYGTYEDQLYGIGGLVVALGERVTSYTTWDGVNFHELVDLDVGGGNSLGALAVQQGTEWYFGLTWSWNFAMPWERGP
jgi:hypothetical protein